MTERFVYPNPPYEVGIPTSADPPLAVPQETELTEYVVENLRSGEILTAPREGEYDQTPITGTATGNLDGLVITFSFGPYNETAYQEGAFTTYYAAGSTIDLDTGAYSLVREGGFPDNSTVNVITPPACPAIPTSGQTWGAIYEVDFTAQATQTISGPGAYTIDGKPWWLKGDGTGIAASTTQSGHLVNGSGLGIRANFGIVFPGVYSGNDPRPFTHWFLPFESIDNYNPAAPIAVQFRLDSTGHEPICGFADCTSDSVGQTVAQQMHTTLIGGTGAHDIGSGHEDYIALGFAGEGTGFQGPGQGIDAYDFNPAYPRTLSSGQFTLIMATQGVVLLSRQLWSGSFSDPWSAKFAITSPSVLPPGHLKDQPFATPSNLGFLFTHFNQTGGTVYDYWLTHLRILQPKIP